jgi:anti-sigma regulatory factor (Ser/Thr protein kinase)
MSTWSIIGRIVRQAPGRRRAGVAGPARSRDFTGSAARLRFGRLIARPAQPVGLPLPQRGHDDLISASLQLSLAPTVAAPTGARVAIGAWLAEEPHETMLAEIALLLVSELVTNSVRRADFTGDEPVVLSASLSPTTLRLEVWDNGTDGDIARQSPRHRHAPGGFGLDLVANLSSGWGVDRDARGTTVWLELAIPAGATA